MARVLITGAAGFTGRHFAALLSRLGHEVHGVVHRMPDEEIEGVSEVHEVDLTDADGVTNLIAAIAPEKVAHLAAVSFVAHSDLREMYLSNILGTRNLLDALANSCADADAVLLASSANVYGNAREGVLDESVPPSPANDYGVTKLASEHLAGLYRNRLPLIVVRPFNYTGRGQSEEFIIPKIVAHVREGRREVELGNIDVARDFSDVRGVVDAYARLLDAPAAIGGTFNICSGRAISLSNVLELVRQLSGHDLLVRVNPAFVRADEVRILCGTANRLEAIIGPLSMPSFEETLRWMLED